MIGQLRLYKAQANIQHMLPRWLVYCNVTLLKVAGDHAITFQFDSARDARLRPDASRPFTNQSHSKVWLPYGYSWPWSWIPMSPLAELADYKRIIRCVLLSEARALKVDCAEIHWPCRVECFLGDGPGSPFVPRGGFPPKYLSWQ